MRAFHPVVLPSLLSIHCSGNEDYLGNLSRTTVHFRPRAESASTVLLDPLLERIQHQEKDIDLIRVHRMDDGEHCDMFWHADAVELVYDMILGAWTHLSKSCAS